MTQPQPPGDAPRRRVPRVAAAAGALAVVVAVSLVAVHVFRSSPAPITVAAEPTTTVPPTTTTTVPPSPVPRLTTIAQISGPIAFYAAPGGPEAGTVPVGRWWGTVKSLPVIDQQPGWLQVRLP